MNGPEYKAKLREELDNHFAAVVEEAFDALYCMEAIAKVVQ